MTIGFQLLLIIVSVLNFVYTMMQIRKSKLNIDDAIYLILFSLILLFMSLFPGAVTALSKLLGFISTSNFVFVFIIFIQYVILLKLQIKVSVLSEKTKSLNQALGLLKKDLEEKEKKSAD